MRSVRIVDSGVIYHLFSIGTWIMRRVWEGENYPSDLSSDSVYYLEEAMLTRVSAQGFRGSKRRMRRKREENETAWMCMVGNECQMVMLIYYAGK